MYTSTCVAPEPGAIFCDSLPLRQATWLEESICSVDLVAMGFKNVSLVVVCVNPLEATNVGGFSSLQCTEANGKYGTYKTNGNKHLSVYIIINEVTFQSTVIYFCVLDLTGGLC